MTPQIRSFDMRQDAIRGNVSARLAYRPSASATAGKVPSFATHGKKDAVTCSGLKFRGAVASSVAAIACLALISSAVGAQTAFGAHSVGDSTTIAVSLAASAPGTVNTVKALTYGDPNLDFSDLGGTCKGTNFAAAGQTCTEQIAFAPQYPGLRLGAIVLLDGNGSPLAMTHVSGTGLGGLAVFAPGNEITVAGTGGWVFGGDGGAATNAQLDLPTSVAIDGAGNLYIADSQHNRIRMVSSGNGATIQNSVSYPQAGYIQTIAGTGFAGFGGDNVLASSTAVTLNNPSGLTLDGAGNLWIADTGNHAIREIVAATGIIQTIAGTGTAGSSGDNGPATSALLNAPGGVTADSQGNLYIADTNNHKIRAVCAGPSTLFNVACPSGGTIVTLAGTGFSNPDGSGGFSGDKGPAISAKLNDPYAVTFDANGNMYIPDSSNNRVRMVSPGGTITTVAGSGNPGYSGDGGSATAASIRMPAAVTVDSAQNLLISDSENSSIRKVSLSTGIITTFLSGASGESTSNQKISNDNLYAPRGITLDQFGNLYIADYYNMRVREIQSNVAFLDFTKNPTQLGNVSSPLSQAIENDGNAQLTLSSVTPDANSLVVSSGTDCGTAAVDIDKQCTISAEFSPTVAGYPLFATILVTGQTDNSPMSLMLAGDAPPANSTTINVSSSQNPAYFGQNIMFTATVSSGAGTGALSGTLAFYDGNTKLADNVAIDSIGNGAFSIATLAIGTHSIVVKYSGDSKHYGSTSSPVSQAVNEQTAVALTSSASPVALGASVTLTATVSVSAGGNVVPDGQIAFLDGTALLNTVNISPAGIAALTTSQLGQGAHTLTAVYNGDLAKFVNGNTSPALTLDVVAGTTLSLASNPNPTTYGTPITFTASLTPAGTGVPTGQITVLDGNTTVGTVNLNGTTGVLTFGTSNLAVGSHSITCSYPGDSNFGPSKSASITQVVNAIQTSTALVATPAQPVAGVPVALTATVTGPTSGAAVTGSLTFLDGTTQLGTANLDSTGHASISISLAPGSHALSASYSGDGNDKGSASNTLNLAVNKATTQVALTSSGSPTDVLATIAFQATISGNGPAPTGTIVFSVDGSEVSTATLNAGGVATFSDSGLAVGTHSVTAMYAGDTDNSSSSATIPQIIVTIPSSTFLTTASAGGSSPQSILVATTTSAAGPVPTGTVTFLNGSTAVGSASLDSGGVATFVPELPPGTYNITAQYAGDAIHGASTSTPVTIFGLAQGFAIAAKPATLQVAAGQSGTLSVQFSSISGFAGTLQLGCLGLPQDVSCIFSSDQVALKAGSKQTVDVIIDTSAHLVARAAPNTPRPTSTPQSLAGMGLPAILLVGIVVWRKRRINLCFVLVVGALVATAIVGISGCTSVTSGKAATGTYTFQVGAIGSASSISQYQSVTLTITQ